MSFLPTLFSTNVYFRWLPVLTLLLTLLHTDDTSRWLMVLQIAVGLALLVVYAGLLLFPGTFTNRLRRGLHVVFIVGVGSALLMIPIWHLQRHLTQKRAADIIQHLDAFRARHGRYPQSLDQLVSAQFPQVPRTALGLWPTEPFRYYTEPVANRPDQSFKLLYTRELMVDAFYSSRTRQWHYDD